MEFIFAIGALAAIAWVGAVFLRGGLVGGSLLVLLAGSCFGFPFFNLPAGPIPLTADRLLLAALVVQYLLFRHWGWIRPLPVTKTDYLFAAFLAALSVSTLTHDFRYHNALPVAQLVFFYAMPATLYWVARQSELNERSARWILSSFAIFGVYLCVTAIAETHQAWDFVFPRYIGSIENYEFFGRGRGPFLNPVANGLVQALGLCAALMAWPRLPRVGQLALLAVVPLFAYGMYCTLTRSVWIGAALAILILIALSTPRAWRVAVLGGAMFASAVGLAATWDHLQAFKRDRDLTAEDMAESAKLRPILAVVAWHMFLDRPLLGCGFGQYIQESPKYLADRTTDLPLEKARPYVQHNVFLALLTQTGLVGAGLFIALFAAWIRTAWRLWRADAPLWVRQLALLFLAFMGAYLPNAMFQDVLIIPMINMLLFFLAGTVAGLTPWLSSRTSSAALKLWIPAPSAELVGEAR